MTQLAFIYNDEVKRVKLFLSGRYATILTIDFCCHSWRFDASDESAPWLCVCGHAPAVSSSGRDTRAADKSLLRSTAKASFLLRKTGSESPARTISIMSV